MLRSRTQLTRTLARKCHRRSISDVSHTYPSKVRAFPFALSQQEAIVRLSWPMSIKCWGRQLIGSFGATFLPGMGFTPLQPNRIQAVYLPVWLVDAEIEAQAFFAEKADGKDPVQRIVTAFTEQSYMPGFVYEPLSRLALNSPAFRKGETIRFTDDLRTQRGTDILCLPFTVTPFPLLDAVRSLSYGEAVISESFRLNPSTVKAHLLAAYPVLVPVYLAQYEMHFGGRNDALPFTVVLEAHTKTGRLIAEDTDKVAAQTLLKDDPSPPKIFQSMMSILSPDEFWVGLADPGFWRHFAQVELYFSTATKSAQTAMELWIGNAASRKGAMEGYQERFFKDPAAAVDWEDLRIREYTAREMEANRMWMNAGKAEISSRFMVKTLDIISRLETSLERTMKQEEGPEAAQTTRTEPPESASAGETHVPGRAKPKTLENFQARGELLAKFRRENKPDWLREWESKVAGAADLPQQRDH